MPIKVKADLPAIKVLESENIFVMPEDVAIKQDIRPLKIIILNLILIKFIMFLLKKIKLFFISIMMLMLLFYIRLQIKMSAAGGCRAFANSYTSVKEHL